MATSSRSNHSPPPPLQPPLPPPHQQPPPPPQQPPQPTQLNLEITIISSKHLKNVNWKSGDLKPYVIFWVDPDHKHTTKSDDSNNTKPVWNQRFQIPITPSLPDAFLTLEIFHSKTSETPKPFVGSTRVHLSTLPEPDNGNLTRVFDVLRPSGRAQGKIRLKLAIKEQPLPFNQSYSTGVEFNYESTPNSSYYYSSAPPFPYTYSSTARSAYSGPVSPSSYSFSMGYSPSAGYLPSSGAIGARSYGAPSAPFPRSGLSVGAVAGGIGRIGLDDETVAESVEESYLGTKEGYYGCRPLY